MIARGGCLPAASVARLLRLLKPQDLLEFLKYSHRHPTIQAAPNRRAHNDNAASMPAGAKAGSPAAAIGEEKAPDGCSFAGAKGCWSGEGDEGLGSTQLGCYTTTPGPRSGSSAPGEDRWVLQDGRWDAQRWRGLPTRSASQEKPGPTARVGRDRGWLISQFHAAQMAGVHSPVSSKQND
jgi:hypothetical protein